MKQIIIHTGFHKTASSSIQHTLGKNRKLLESYGYVYPDLVISGKRFFNLSIPFSGYYMPDPENFKHYWYHTNLDYQVVNQQIGQFINNSLSNFDKVIISDEFISALNQKSLMKMKTDFEDLGFSLRVISYVREPYKLLVSSVQQRTKSRDIKKVLKSMNFKSSYERVENLQQVFGEQAEFYCFESVCEHDGGPVAFFFDLLKIPQEMISQAKVNESLSNQSARLASFINETAPLFLGNKIYPLRERFDIAPIFSLKGEKFALTETEFKSVEDGVIMSRKEHSRLLGDDFFPGYDPKFSDEVVPWSDGQISQLLEISKKLDMHLQIRIIDYFKQLDMQSGTEYINKIQPLTKQLRKRLNRERLLNVSNIKAVLFNKLRASKWLRLIRAPFK